MTDRTVGTLLIGIGLVVCQGCSSEEPTLLPSGHEDRPPIIFITVDTLRADHLGLYGYSRPTSPELDEFGSRAFVFEDAFAQAPCTRPSVWNIMTSSLRAPIPIPAGTPTIAGFLHEQGYETAAIVSQGAFRDGGENLSQGFDHYFVTWGDDLEGRPFDYFSPDADASALTDRAIEWLSRGRERPPFLWLHYFDPHDPYVVHSQEDGMFGDSDPQQLSQRRAELRTWMEGIMQLESRQGDADAEENALESSVIEQLNDAYDEEVHFLDRNLGRLFDFIDGRAAVDGESLIFLTADHGEQLADNGWFWGHCASLSREELHVPMLLRLPGQKAGRRVVGAVQTIDVFPTIVELVAPESAKTISLEGRSLVPLLRSEESMDPGFAFSGWIGETSIISGEHQLLFDDDGERLLRLVDGTPVSDEAEANRLKALSGGQSAEDSGYDEAIIERLKANGYLR